MPRARKQTIEGLPDEMPEITKNEVIQENNFYKAIKKYEGKEPFNYVPILVIIAAIIIALILIFL